MLWTEVLTVRLIDADALLRHKRKKTNADRIRAMSDEELANVLHEFAAKPMQGSFLKWLQQPAEEVERFNALDNRQ